MGYAGYSPYRFFTLASPSSGGGGGPVNSISGNLVCDGDSITAGLGLTTPGPYPKNLALSGSWVVTNVAVSGNMLSDCITNAPTTVDPLYTPGKKNVVIIWAGTNDFAFGSTVSTVYGRFQTYAAARRAVGWKVVVVTMISRAGNNPNGETLDTDKNGLNALLRPGYNGFSDGIADIASNAELGADGAYAGPGFQGDHIHPTQTAVLVDEVPIFNATMATF